MYSCDELHESVAKLFKHAIITLNPHIEISDFLIFILYIDFQILIKICRTKAATPKITTKTTVMKNKLEILMCKFQNLKLIRGDGGYNSQPDSQILH